MRVPRHRVRPRFLTGLAVALMAGWVACASPTPEQELSTALDVARAATRDSTRVPEAVGLLETFVRSHPQDDGVPEALMQLAILRQQRGDIAGAIRDYERILSQFPTAATADKAQFMIAFVNEEHLGDLAAARSAYQAVIDNYPDSDLAMQARQLLQHVGQAPDTWVEFRDDDEEADR